MSQTADGLLLAGDENPAAHREGGVYEERPLSTSTY